jgi:hypothetical protein
MDEILNDRYAILIANYPVDSRVLSDLRKDILENLYEGYRLRADAALILISLFDQMIIRPYHGPLHRSYANPFFKPEVVQFPLPQKFREMDDEKFLDQCRAALGLIMKSAQRDDDKVISSHSIIRSIDASWESLSEMFGWG